MASVSGESGPGKKHAHSLATMDATNAVAELTLGAFQMVLMHGSKYLTTCDLGRLSICCKTMSNMTEETGAWKRVFEEAVSGAAMCKAEIVPIQWHKNHKKSTWNGEPGLLECFAKPTSQVITSAGYKQAASCLLSKTCFHCGKMAGTANPVTMTRTCDGCSDSLESHWITSKSKAKEAFLLSENDCSSLKSASIPFVMSIKPDAKVKTSVVFLISDIMELSFAKHGGADGLAAEFAKRKTSAANRYQKKQSTDKPQKKRPKIEQLSDRPADDLASLRYFCTMSNFPIPTVIPGQIGRVEMTHSSKCNVCNARGTLRDIVPHERLEHNIYSTEYTEDVVPETCPPFAGVSLSIPPEISPAEELVQLVASAVVQYESCSANYSWDERCVSKRFNTTFTFGDCRVAVDCDKFIGTDIDVNNIDISYQTRPSTLPVRLLHLEWGETFDPFDESSKKSFQKLNAALGLQETRSSQLVAALIARAVGVEAFLESYCEDDPSEAAYPNIYSAWTLLKACRDTSSK